MNIIKKIITNLIGELEYIVTITCVSGEIKMYKFSDIKSLDEFVLSFNSDRYWNVSKIEKRRKFDFKYTKEINHRPLYFNLEDVCEEQDGYSFLVKDESLTNIKRIM